MPSFYSSQHQESFTLPTSPQQAAPTPRQPLNYLGRVLIYKGHRGGWREFRQIKRNLNVFLRNSDGRLGLGGERTEKIPSFLFCPNAPPHLFLRLSAFMS